MSLNRPPKLPLWGVVCFHTFYSKMPLEEEKNQTKDSEWIFFWAKSGKIDQNQFFSQGRGLFAKKKVGFQ